MAIFSVEIGDADILRVLNAVSANYNRPETIQNPNWIGPTIQNPNFNPDLGESEENPSTIDNPEPETIENPESKAAFANRMVRQFLAEHVMAYEKRIAKEQAAAAVNVSISINDPQA